MDGRKVFAVLLVVAAVSSTAVVVADETGPMADAGLDRSVDLGETVYLDASGSRAVSGDIDGFQWYVTPPDGERERLEAGDSARHTYVPDSAGKWRFTVEVTGTNEEVSEDYVDVWVEKVSSEDKSDQSDVGSNGSNEEQDDNDDSGDETNAGNPSEQKPTPHNNTPTNTPQNETEEDNQPNDTTTPDIQIQGPEVVVAGEVEEYTANSDISIDKYYWEINGERTLEKYEGKQLEYKFDSDVETINIELTGVTSSNESNNDNKEIVVVEPTEQKNESPPPQSHELLELRGELLMGGDSAPVFEIDVFDRSLTDDIFKGVEQETVRYSTKEISDSETDLKYIWEFGDGTRTITHQPEVEHKYRTDIVGWRDYEVSVTAVDQYGNEDTITKTAEILGQPVATSQKSIELVDRSHTDLTATFKIEVFPDQNSIEELYELNFGDGTSINLYTDQSFSSLNSATYEMTHQYEEPGTYTAWLSANTFSDTGEDIRETVTFDSYTEYHYTERTTAVAEYVSEDDPGEGWEKVGIDTIEKEVVDRQETRIREEQHPDALLSDDWRRIGSETETEQRRETRVAANWPGSDWSMAERAVDSETRIVGYDYVEVPHRSLAPTDGTYVGTTTNYHTTTERERSTSRPAGSGWSRVRSTGQVRDGTGTTWRSSRRAPAPGWRVVDSRTVTDYYTETERYCKERTNSWFGEGRCIDWGERTVWKSDTTREYKFEYPTYSTEYLWERTTSTPEVYYEYRVPEYERQDLHRWERTYTDEVEYGVYEKLEYETTTTYEWEKEIERDVDRVSLTPPDTDEVDVIGEVSERVVACGSGDGELEDEGCT